jgi:hypothetical protein
MCRDATKASLNSNATPNRRKWKRFGYWKICRERGGERDTLMHTKHGGNCFPPPP